ncbi:hypothetical protein FIBSPDRAFT_876112 [Athelia psychrophila]|uniref:Uncharacterized protein n=1 Tax=Athelia psychrophila TaxID=1759441 RepID=A0A167X5T8_9AGAM|nr:hypothetical protein FIBSPDRAFT_876112 [Fibularhizoctonia sp. CBS 109695]
MDRALDLQQLWPGPGEANGARGAGGAGTYSAGASPIASPITTSFPSAPASAPDPTPAPSPDFPNLAGTLFLLSQQFFLLEM